MATGHMDTELAVLNLLERYGVMTMDEILIRGQPEFSWAQVFLAIDRMSRKNLIALYRTSGNYQLVRSVYPRTVAQASQQAESAPHPR